jgi:hypothetical protein
MMKKVFLTGNRDPEWRWDVADFLIQREIDVVDPGDALPDTECAFKYLKVLESCDLLIAYLIDTHTHPLLSMLEMGYASKLAKDVVIVDNVPYQRSWLHSVPYSQIFANVQGLKAYLSKMLVTPPKHPRLFG